MYQQCGIEQIRDRNQGLAYPGQTHPDSRTTTEQQGVARRGTEPEERASQKHSTKEVLTLTVEPKCRQTGGYPKPAPTLNTGRHPRNSVPVM